MRSRLRPTIPRPNVADPLRNSMPDAGLNCTISIKTTTLRGIRRPTASPRVDCEPPSPSDERASTVSPVAPTDQRARLTTVSDDIDTHPDARSARPCMPVPCNGRVAFLRGSRTSHQSTITCDRLEVAVPRPNCQATPALSVSPSEHATSFEENDDE